MHCCGGTAAFHRNGPERVLWAPRDFLFILQMGLLHDTSSRLIDLRGKRNEEETSNGQVLFENPHSIFISKLQKMKFSGFHVLNPLSATKPVPKKWASSKTQIPFVSRAAETLGLDQAHFAKNRKRGGLGPPAAIFCVWVLGTNDNQTVFLLPYSPPPAKRKVAAFGAPTFPNGPWHLLSFLPNRVRLLMRFLLPYSPPPARKKVAAAREVFYC